MIEPHVQPGQGPQRPPVRAMAPSRAAASRAATHRILLVAGAAVGMAGGFAALYFATLSIFLKPMAASFGWGRGQLSAVALLSMVGSALAAPVVGRLIDRYGAQRVVGASALLLAAGLFCLAKLPPSLTLLSILSFAVGALATATTPPGYLSVFPQYFDRRLGAALGFAMLGLGTGVALAPVLAQNLIAAHGWRHAYLILAMFALGLGVLANALCFGGRRDGRLAGTEAGAGGAAAAPLEGDTLAAALRMPRFWLMALALMLVSAAALGAMIHLFSMLTDRGIAAPVAAGAAATVGVAAAAGRFVTGLLLDHFQARVVTAVVFVLGGIGLLLLAFSGAASPVAAYTAGAALFGLAIGAEGDIIPFLARRYFGRRAFGAVFGCLFSAYMLGAFAGPMAYGVAFDRLGGYSAPLIAGAIACALGACLVLAVGPYRYSSTPSSEHA